MKRILSKTILSAVVGVFLVGCYPAGPEFVEDLDVVYSTYDQEYDFKSQGTYSMPDQIVTDVKIDNGDTTYVYMKKIYADPILAAIDQNMEKLGWDKIDIENGPDVLVTPSVMSSTTYYYSYWYNWWYGGYYGGYWGWYYPPYYTVSSYTTGSLIITMADPNVESVINQSPAVWVSAANGLVTGYNDVDRVVTAINQAFVQSPYLKTN
jgi:Domain of unknown function (DUF4136)